MTTKHPDWVKRGGIPYASWIEPDYKERECPVCGERFTEKTDSVGETISHNYGTHFTEAHMHLSPVEVSAIVKERGNAKF